ncbi:MAG: hypothetical protein OEM63_03370 [Gammaproteobacteria bacterium]|nr:hypothetical protein [Gammaproteobacteria bacterium]
MPDRRATINALAWIVLTTPAAVAQDLPRLLYGQEKGSGCEIAVWDAAKDESMLLADVDTCPEQLFVSADGETAFFVDRDTLIVAPTRAGSKSTSLPMPALDYHRWAADAETRMHPKNLEMIAEHVMKPAAAGFFDNGDPAIQLQMFGPADDSLVYLLAYDGQAWSLKDGRSCGRWEFPCTFDPSRYRSSDVWTWPESRMVWHPDIASNPYYAGAESVAVDLEFESYQAADQKRFFHVDGKRSEISFFTRPSEHSDTLHTFGVTLSVDGGNPRELSGNQCLTSVAGRYILVNEFFLSRFEVTDIGTGQTVIANLKAAMWLN